jgi:hypothetical protein
MLTNFLGVLPILIPPLCVFAFIMKAWVIQWTVFWLCHTGWTLHFLLDELTMESLVDSMWPLLLTYLLGPCWLLTGTHPLLVMVQWLLLYGPLLLPLMLKGNQIVSLLLKLSLQPFCLSLFFQLFALIFLPRSGRRSKVKATLLPGNHWVVQRSMQWRQNGTK